MQGAACTCVVTEYRYHEADNFSVDVHPFSTDELRAQFGDMVSSYRHNYFASEHMDTADERRSWEERSKLALDTLGAMFRGRLTENLLRSEAVPEEDVVETLLAWAAELGPGTDHTSHTVDTLEQCADLLARLTSEEQTATGSRRGGVATWPYIKTITVSLNAYILSKGLVLVDLPGMSFIPPQRNVLTEAGLRDLNSARRNITERHLLECDDIFAVCPIGRATTDASVQDVFDRARQARLSNVSIICTMCDVSCPPLEVTPSYVGPS